MTTDLFCLVNGVPSCSDDWRTTQPRTGEEVRFQVATSKVLDAALDSLKSGKPITPASSSQLEQVLLELDRNFLTFARWFSVESGYLLRDSMAMVGAAKSFCSDLCQQSATIVERASIPFSSSNNFYCRNATVKYLPRGRLAVVLPANSPWPLALIYALAANQARCPVLILPSSRAPLSGLAAAKCVQVLGEHSGISILNYSTREALVAGYSRKCFDGVHFVGSNRWYSDIASDCARNGISLTYEGEGNCAAIVDASTDEIPAIAEILYAAALRCNGQLCSSVSGILCTERCYAPLRDRLTQLFSNTNLGDSLDQGIDLGPLLGTADLLNASIENAERLGAKILAGGKGQGRNMPATLVEIENEQWEFAKKENFGPVVWIRSLPDLENIVPLLDDIGSGLTVSIFGCETRQLVQQITSRARFARVCLNCDPTVQSPAHPWGNYGTSGISHPQTFLEKCFLPVTFESDIPGGALINSSCLKMTAPGKLVESSFRVSSPADHMVVENLYSGVCGTDREVFRGHLEAAFPFIPGHENVGKVHSVPEGRLFADGVPIKSGDLITWNPLISCQRCAACTQGCDNCCPHLQVFGLSTPCEVSPHLFGGWSQFSFIPPEARVHKILEQNRASSFIFADPTATGLRVFDLSNQHRGEWLVIGGGALGSAILATLVSLQAGPIWVAANPDQRIVLGDLCGEHVIPMTRSDSLTSSKLLSRNVRPEFVVDTIGTEETINASMQAARPGATIFLVGGLAPRRLPFDSGSLTKSEVAIRGVLAYSSNQFSRAIQLISENLSIYETLNPRRLPLSEAADQIFSRSSRKTIVECQA